MMKHLVRSIVLGLVATAMAYAHPTDVAVGSPTNLSEMRQEKLAFVQHRAARAVAERDAFASLALDCEAEAIAKRAAAEAFAVFDERGAFAD